MMQNELRVHSQGSDQSCVLSWLKVLLLAGEACQGQEEGGSVVMSKGAIN